MFRLWSKSFKHVGQANSDTAEVWCIQKPRLMCHMCFNILKNCQESSCQNLVSWITRYACLGIQKNIRDVHDVLFGLDLCMLDPFECELVLCLDWWACMACRHMSPGRHTQLIIISVVLLLPPYPPNTILEHVTTVIKEFQTCWARSRRIKLIY